MTSQATPRPVIDNDALYDALNRQDHISQCLVAVVDLTVCDHIDTNARNRIGLLLDLLQKEYQSATNAARTAATNHCRGAIQAAH